MAIREETTAVRGRRAAIRTVMEEPAAIREETTAVRDHRAAIRIVMEEPAATREETTAVRDHRAAIRTVMEELAVIREETIVEICLLYTSILWCVQGSLRLCSSLSVIIWQQLDNNHNILNEHALFQLNVIYMGGRRDLAGIFQFCGDPVAGCVPCIFYSIF